MNAGEYLGQTLEADRRIGRLLEEKMALEAAAARTGAAMGRERVCQSPDVTRMQEIVCRLSLKKDEIDTATDRLADLKAEISEKLAAVGDEAARRVLSLRYLECLSWKEIIARTGSGRSTVFHCHTLGLAALDRLLREEHLAG